MRRTRSLRREQIIRALVLIVLPLSFLLVIFDLIYRPIYAQQLHEAAMRATAYNTNEGVKDFVTDFFTEYGAEELIPIIACESEFKHYSENGKILRNKQGSSAIGVAQIMASVHPDPTVIAKYNRRNRTQYKVEDFEIATLSGNVWYALVLYKTRGIRDWECSKYI
tara:strand:+ start:2326 stop:2823 length:498 start_codon:yes stop_codon:yes gene_type:complete